MQKAWLALGIIAVCLLAWIASEHHRQSCIREGRIECSVLPWDNGKMKPSPNPSGGGIGGSSPGF